MKKIIAGSSIAAMLLAAAPAFANSNGIKVTNNNIGTLVTNEVSVGSNTGYNWVSGGNGGDGGDTGKATAKWGGSATSGSAGDGGSSDNWGTIFTGNAVSGSVITNVVNSNDTDIKDSCGCDEEQGPAGKIKVKNENIETWVGNGVWAASDTGYNGVSGGNGGLGGSTGKAKAVGDDSVAKSGSGGNGGSSTNWGWIETGNATSISEIANVVNTNITRIKR